MDNLSTYSINTVERHENFMIFVSNYFILSKAISPIKKDDQLCDNGHFPIQKDEKISPSKSSAK